MESRRVSLAAVVAAALGVASPAGAADVPSLVGTWTPIGEDHAVARHGAASDHRPPVETPALGGTANLWTYVIEAQEGRAFHGYVLSPKGVKDTIVGVVPRNGQDVLMSHRDGEVQGEFIGDQMELCWIDRVPERATAACSLVAKQGS